ncbi:MAG: CBS domain-containing protein [Candidatus Dadabacteria bacterium]|nr:MAG: CBS domain-containing protein [Candidatus Dadabacteria bacterium]
MDEKLSVLHPDFLNETVEFLKPQEALTVTADSTAYSAVECLKEHHSGALLVTSSEGSLRGIFTERDVLTKLALFDNDLRAVPVQEVMTEDPESIELNASIARALYMLSTGGYRHLVVTSSEYDKPRMISVVNILDHIFDASQNAESSTVVDPSAADRFFTSPVAVLKPARAITVSDSTTIKEAVETMNRHLIGALPVIDSNGSLCGIFTERDLLEKIILTDLTLDNTPVAEVMTKNPDTAGETEDNVASALRTLKNGHYRHIPVNCKDYLGILSIKNFISYLAHSILEDMRKN